MGSHPAAALQGAVDYVAVTCESAPIPVLGFTQHVESESAYPILLRALASLIELTAPARFSTSIPDIAWYMCLGVSP